MGGLCHKKEGEEGDVNDDSLLPGNEKWNPAPGQQKTETPLSGSWEMKPCSLATVN